VVWTWQAVEETQDPGHRPAPCRALSGHGVNIEWGFGILHPVTRITYLKRETKQGSMLSCAQYTDSVHCEKTIVENLNSFFLAAEQFF